MKNLFFISIFSLFLLVLGCKKDSKESDDKDTKATVTYNASVDDPINFKLLVGYTPQDASELIQTVVESPFSYDIDAEFGTFLYVSVSAVPRVETYEGTTTVRCNIRNGDKLIRQDSDPIFAVAQYIFGQD